MDEETRTLEVGEELVAQTRAVGRTLDQPRDVGDRELALVRPVHDAENGLERRERIVGDLGLGVRDAAQERRLAGIREAGERGVDDELQTQLEVELVAGKPRLRKARRLPGRRREARVAATALAPARGDVARVGRREIGDEAFVGVEELRPDRHANLGVLAVGTVLLAPAPVATTPRLDVLDPPECREVAKARIDDDDDISAAAAVTTVGAALRDVLLATEAQSAVASAARLGMDVRSVVEHGSPAEAECPLYSADAATEMKRLSPDRRNSTVPSRSAKIVSSRPRPAPGPGRNFVPRCRTMIIPVFTGCPAKIFTPSRFDSESRPLREEPRPFLCAIRTHPP